MILNLSNTVKYNLRDKGYYYDEFGVIRDFENGTKNWYMNLDLMYIYHKSFYPFQFSTRFSSDNRFLSKAYGGEKIRGIPDERIKCGYALYLNNNLYLTLFNFPGFVEVQAGLLLDLALILDPVEGKHISQGYDFYTDNFYYTAGIEILVYPEFAKSLFLRATLGFNLEKVFENRSFNGDETLELFIGIGHYF